MMIYFSAESRWCKLAHIPNRPTPSAGLSRMESSRRFLAQCCKILVTELFAGPWGLESTDYIHSVHIRLKQLIMHYYSTSHVVHKQTCKHNCEHKGVGVALIMSLIHEQA